jgi:hypothetical protein
MLPVLCSMLRHKVSQRRQAGVEGHEAQGVGEGAERAAAA